MRLEISSEVCTLWLFCWLVAFEKVTGRGGSDRRKGKKEFFFVSARVIRSFIYIVECVFSSTCMFGGQNCLKEAIRTSDEAGAVVRLK